MECPYGAPGGSCPGGEETWRPIPGSDAAEVSDHGRVRVEGRLAEPEEAQKGMYRVDIGLIRTFTGFDWSLDNYPLRRLVKWTFDGGPYEIHLYEIGEHAPWMDPFHDINAQLSGGARHVRHVNRDSKDHHLNNLVWFAPIKGMSNIKKKSGRRRKREPVQVERRLLRERKDALEDYLLYENPKHRPLRSSLARKFDLSRKMVDEVINKVEEEKVNVHRR